MKRKIFVISIAVMFTLGIGLGYAGERAVKLSGTYAGSFFDHEYDSDGIGPSANVATIEGKGATGFYSATAFFEAILAAPTGVCAGGTIQLGYVFDKVIITYKNGDQLYAEADPAESYICLDPATFDSEYKVKHMITGGTGKYEGATGYYIDQGHTTAIVIDPVTLVVYGALNGETEGVIYLE